MATIQGVYLALFGRPADPLGLAYFNGITNNGTNLAAIGPLQSSAEYTTRFTGQSNTQIINSIYKSLFNRDADLPGLTFFSDALAKGTLSIANIAIAIYDGAQGADKTIRDLKEAAADAFTKAVDTAAEVIAYNGTAAASSGATFIAGVTTTAPTAAQVDAAVLAATTQPQTPSSTVNLTPNPDVVTGTAGNDVFNGALGGATFTTVTVQSFDAINGGAGTDKLIAVGIGNLTTTTTTLQSVEQLQIIGATDTNTLDLTATTGVQSIAIEAPVGSYTVQGINAGIASLSAANVVAGGTVTFTASNAAVSGSADAVALALQAVGTSATAANVVLQPTSGTNGFETVNVTTSGGASNIALTTTGTKTINVEGATALTAALATATVETFDASKATGSISVAVAAGSGVQTIKTGTANDTIDLFNAASTYTTADTIDGGAGRDTVELGAADLTTTSVRTNLANIEVLRNGDAVGAATVKLSNFGAAVDGFTLGLATNGTTIDYGSTKTGTFSIANVNNNGNTVTLSSGSATTDDAVAISSGSATNTTADDGGTVVLNNFETVTLTAAGASATYAALTVSPSVGASSTLTISGDQSVTIGTLTVASGAVTGGATAGTISASGLTGTAALNIGLAASANVTGSVNADNIFGSGAADVINGGAGNDRLAGNAGIDTITTGTGSDTVIVGAGAAIANLTNANRDVVTDFTSGTGGDIIEVNGNATDEVTALTAFVTATGTYNVTSAAVANFATAASVNVFNFNTTAGSSATSLDTTLGGANALDGTNLLLAIGNGGAATLNVTDTQQGFIVAYQNSNAYVYHFVDSAAADTTLAAAEIQLVGVLQNVAFGSLTAANFA